ncbi:hypothetical protein C7999DRAFT_37714 [Corynascus novoguineensis]|uniref:LOV domain-containing protein n=1 Tax=Corynascus novoguineensis TaxID=1126955 RepID=A0AAN7HUA2_9PEZI|nr:hypothetical protein C7999DRAFT_37714 [Corynascus novoguineensis]
MMPARSDTDDSLPTLKDDPSRAGSTRTSPVLVMPHQYDRQCSNPIMTALSPPPAALKHPKSRRQKSHLRLRSDSGLGLHTNQGALRHRVLPDFFEPAVVKLAFSNQTTVRKLRAFAETRHGGSDLDFLLKVEEYSRALGDLISSMSHISSKFTGLTATTPLELSSDAASALKSDIKYCVRSALPVLEKVYQEAKIAAEERLSQTLYPEFVKYQLGQLLTTSLLKDRPGAEEVEDPYPGLGNAFCLTDPLQPDNPVTFASDGLLSMAGYHRKQLIGENCRLFQGIATNPDTARRLSQVVESGREATELVLNYRLDGTPYWNLLYICPLMENGTVRYFLGAQVSVSENMGCDYNEILSVLNFGRPSEEAGDPVAEWPVSLSWPAEQSSETLDLDQEGDQQSDRPMSRRQRFFRRFYRKGSVSHASSNSRLSTASEHASDESQPPVHSPRCPSTLASPRPDSHYTNHCHQHTPTLDQHSTPYSRFLVMRYPPSPRVSSNRRRSRRRDDSAHSGRRVPTADPASQLPIAFCSTHALSLLGVRLSPTTAQAYEPAAPLLDRDVFAVLSSHLRSPTASSRAFKANVLAQLARGECVAAELLVPSSSSFTSSPSTPTASTNPASAFSAVAIAEGSSSSSASAAAAASGGAGAGGKSARSVRAAGGGGGDDAGGGGSGASSVNRSTCNLPRPSSPIYGDPSSSDSRPRLSGTLDRGAEFLSQMLFAGGGGGGGATGGIGGKGVALKRLVSRWVPLKDEAGEIGWVVLILVPAEGGGA